MKIVILILCLLSSTVLPAQQGQQYVAVEYKTLIDPEYQKIIGRNSEYYLVEYDYGQPPPDPFEIMRAFFCRTDSIRGWKIRFEELTKMQGATEGIYAYIVKQSNPKATFYRKEYNDTLLLDYGLDAKLNIKIK